jgi:hypothetical protein
MQVENRSERERKELRDMLVILFAAYQRYNDADSVKAYSIALNGVPVADVNRACKWFLDNPAQRCPFAGEVKLKAYELSPRTKRDDDPDSPVFSGRIPKELSAIMDALTKAEPGKCRRAVVEAGLTDEQAIEEMERRTREETGIRLGIKTKVQPFDFKAAAAGEK